MKQRAFTLVEVLVTISVISVLAALTVPVLSNARSRARSVQCVGNLRQWGVATGLYMNQNSGAIPRRGQGIQPLTVIDRSADWFNCLPPCIGLPAYRDLVARGIAPRPGDNSLFVCPEAGEQGAQGRFMSYAMNMYLSPWIRPEPHNISEFDSPGQVVFMADGPGGYSAAVPSSRQYSVQARHAGCANVLFIDGHVESFAADYLGCGKGDPHHDDVRWLTGTQGVNQPPLD